MLYSRPNQLISAGVERPPSPCCEFPGLADHFSVKSQWVTLLETIDHPQFEP
jgi:hypothetical protein